MPYLTEAQIDEMADVAARSFKITGSWRAAAIAARQYARAELGTKPRPTIVSIALRIAQIRSTIARQKDLGTVDRSDV